MLWIAHKRRALCASQKTDMFHMSNAELGPAWIYNFPNEPSWPLLLAPNINIVTH